MAAPSTLPKPGTDKRVQQREALAMMLAGACTRAPLDWEIAEEADFCLLLLARSAQDRVRQSIANTLADCPWAPRSVVRFLASDTLDIAHPVVTRCLALSDDDLIAIARIDTERRLMIASRARVSARLTVTLARYREREVLTQLARNSGARLDEHSAGDFAAVAKGERELQTALASRDDLTRGFARALIAVATDAIVERLRSRFPDLPAPALKEAAAQAAGLAEEEDADSAAARLIGRLDASGRLDAAFALRALDEARGAVFDHAIARLCGLPVRTWRRALSAAPVRACALAGRVIGADRASVATMVRGLVRDGRVHAMEPADIAVASEQIFSTYQPLDAGRALRTLGAPGSIAH